MLFLKRVFLVSCACLIACRFLDDAVFGSDSSDEETALLVIGVLSAQNNSAARSSIRQTWKTLARGKKIKLFFLIGKGFCPIHPNDRKSEMSCEAFEFPSDSAQQLSNAMWTPNILDDIPMQHTKSGIASFTFRVNFPVIVRAIRVWRKALQSSFMGVVNLKAAKSGDLVTTVSFEPPLGTLPKSENDWVEIKTNPFLLPKLYDVEVEFFTKNQNETKIVEPFVPCYGVSSWFNFGGSIEFTTQYGPKIGWVKFHGNSCAPVSLLLELNDLKTYLDQRHSRSIEWQRQITALSQRVKHESYVEKDILFLDVLDVYKNIPKKILKFYEWIYSNFRFSFLLKTDDDTFIDILAVEQYLMSLKEGNEVPEVQSHLWWWGRFRFGLPVERHGKWQELEYKAPVYPPFPCGGGYILNRNVIRYLVASSRWLHIFQGEDTSLGIWLSGIHTSSPKDATCQWSCEGECDEHSCNKGQLSVNEMFSVWQQYQKQKRLC